MLRMNARIDDQPNRAEKFVTEASQVSEWIVVVPSDLFRQPFAVERPAFYVRVNGSTLRNCGTPLSSSAVESCQW